MQLICPVIRSQGKLSTEETVHHCFKLFKHASGRRTEICSAYPAMHEITFYNIQFLVLQYDGHNQVRLRPLTCLQYQFVEITWHIQRETIENY